jgi:phosphatidylglycerol:prolipoprotein diacylglycerol transferase
MLPLSIEYPSWIHPELFPGVPVLGLLRWYGLMYIFAFTAAWFVLRRLAREGALDSPDDVLRSKTRGFSEAKVDDALGFFTTGIVGLLLGARIFSTLIYDTTGVYVQKPWLIFWPFDETGHFTGLAGMSYHGGYIGGLAALVLWCWRHKRPLLKWVDAMSIAIPAGYSFGRLGNFLNGELYGRVTTVPWGMTFPAARRFSLSLDWVRQTAEQAGIDIPPDALLINLPRHPSQLYEAFFEGIFLFVILWLVRKHKPFDGFMAALYSIGYGAVRFFIEYFREPDTDIGYRIAAKGDAATYLNESWLNISTGQILCVLMIAAGLAFILAGRWRSRKGPAAG